MIPRRGLVGLVFTLFSSALVVGFQTSDPSLMALGPTPFGPGASGSSGTAAPGAAAAGTPSANPTTTLNENAAGASAGTSTQGIGSAPTAPGSAPTPATPAVTIAASGYRDGTYTGTGEQTPFETIAVQMVIKGGKIIDITPTALSTGRGRSGQINNYAIPILRSEALSAQSAQIDTVSGATWTSQGYAASLQSALDMAKV